MLPDTYGSLGVFAFAGAGLGLILKKLAHGGKLRNPKQLARLSTRVAGATLYLYWCIYLTLELHDGALTNLIIWPGQIIAGFDTLTARNVWYNSQHTTRKFNLRGNSSRTESTDPILLCLMWLADAGLLIVFTIVVVRSQAEKPFSKATSEWAIEEPMAHALEYGASIQAMRKKLEAGQFSTLTPYVLALEPALFARLTLYSHPGDASCHYLTLENITINRKEGGLSESTTPVVQNLTISPATYQELKERLGPAPGSQGRSCRIY